MSPVIARNAQEARKENPMPQSTRRIWAALAAVLVGYGPAPACDICTGNLQSRQTLRQEAARRHDAL